MNLKVEYLSTKGTWREIADAARTTIGMEQGKKEPSSKWKKNMLLAEHSPIRKMHISWKWIDIPYWVSVHLVRHKVGIEHFVKSQRTDKTNINRNNLPQNALVNHECEANLQAIINISRKRLCNQASKETREAWKLFLESIKNIEPELYSVCQPECIYRGFCPEIKSCGWYKTEEYKIKLKEYRKLS